MAFGMLSRLDGYPFEFQKVVFVAGGNGELYEDDKPLDIA